MSVELLLSGKRKFSRNNIKIVDFLYAACLSGHRAFSYITAPPSTFTYNVYSKSFFDLYVYKKIHSEIANVPHVDEGRLQLNLLN